MLARPSDVECRASRTPTQTLINESNDDGSVVVPITVPLRPGRASAALTLVELLPFVAAFALLALLLFCVGLFLRPPPLRRSLEGGRLRSPSRHAVGRTGGSESLIEGTRHRRAHARSIRARTARATGAGAPIGLRMRKVHLQLASLNVDIGEC